MEKLILKGGKFFRGSEFVPLEFGNIEQIKIIEEKQKLLTNLNGSGLVLDVWCEEIKHYEVKTDFICINCDKRVYIEREVDDDTEKQAILGTHSCWHCKQKYKIEKNDDSEYVVKVVSK